MRGSANRVEKAGQFHPIQLPIGSDAGAEIQAEGAHVLPFAHHWTAALLGTHALSCQQRMQENGKPFITDSQNFIYDLQLKLPIENPETVEKALRSIPGVVETGFFFGLAGRVIIGQSDGSIKILS